MRTIASVVIPALLAIGLSLLAQERPVPATRPSIHGVWRAVEQTINDRTLKDANLGVGFHIYTGRHFAVVRESDIPPRPPAPVENASAAQLKAAYGPFVAQFGTYQVSGDLITETVLVAKNPENAGNSSTRRFKIEGDTLVTEPVKRVPGARSITLKFVRVE